LAPLLYRASPVDPILRPASVPISEGEFERFTNVTGTSNETRAPSPQPPPSIFGHSLSRPSSTSTQTSIAPISQQFQPQFHTRGASLSQPQNKYNLSLPGLSALANAASASPLQQRYAPDKTYARSNIDTLGQVILKQCHHEFRCGTNTWYCRKHTCKSKVFMLQITTVLSCGCHAKANLILASPSPTPNSLPYRYNISLGQGKSNIHSLAP
jgi:hypothetical protein